MLDVIDEEGFRAGVGIILVNEHRRVFWARRIRPKNAWQFPQGGLLENETPKQAMYRELYEETGLKPEHVDILAETQEWLRYRLPKRLIRYHSKPLCLGQKQKWFLLKCLANDDQVCFDATDTPEFNLFRWVSYWYPLKQVIAFKRSLYREALREFAGVLFDRNDSKNDSRSILNPGNIDNQNQRDQ